MGVVQSGYWQGKPRTIGSAGLTNTLREAEMDKYILTKEEIEAFQGDSLS